MKQTKKSNVQFPTYTPSIIPTHSSSHTMFNQSSTPSLIQQGYKKKKDCNCKK